VHVAQPEGFIFDATEQARANALSLISGSDGDFRYVQTTAGGRCVRQAKGISDKLVPVERGKREKARRRREFVKA
jgi:hypothetical protein